MRKLKAFFRRHRPRRRVGIIINILFAALIVFVIYILKGSPALSDEMALRRAETERLIGPGEILAAVDTESDAYPEIIVVDEGEGAALFTTKESGVFSSAQRRLYYREKTGDLTLMAEPHDGHMMIDCTHICVFAFDSLPRASYAELELTLKTELNGVEFEHTYSARAEREQVGFFMFRIDRLYPEEETEQYAFAELATTSNDFYHNPRSFPATVRLYDSAGTLLAEYETAVRNRTAALEEN